MGGWLIRFTFTRLLVHVFFLLDFLARFGHIGAKKIERIKGLLLGTFMRFGLAIEKFMGVGTPTEIQNLKQFFKI